MQWMPDHGSCGLRNIGFDVGDIVTYFYRKNTEKPTQRMESTAIGEASPSNGIVSVSKKSPVYLLTL